jgi:predicted enzyme related to lactoylglutathione lyase
MSLSFRVLAITLLLPGAPQFLAAQGAPRLPALNESASGLRLPGKFVWFDLATPALSEQQAFYQDVFGWTYRSPGLSEDEYVLVLNRGRAIAGMFRAEPPGGEQDGATWISLMSVNDVANAVRESRGAGGDVEVAAASVPNRGRHALLRDPAGALFGVLRSDSGDPPDEEVPIGGILWVDLFARDVQAMADFYRRMAPYEVSVRHVAEGVDGRLLTAQGMPRAGIVPVDEEANRSAWVPYVRVEDVEATLALAVDGGGFVIVAPDPDLLNGDLGVFVDPNGGVMGVVKWDYTGRLDP